MRVGILGRGNVGLSLAGQLVVRDHRVVGIHRSDDSLVVVQDDPAVVRTSG